VDKRFFWAEQAWFDPFEVDGKEKDEIDPQVFPFGEPPAVTHRSTSSRLPSACRAGMWKCTILTRAKYKIKGYAANMKGYKWCPDRILQQPYNILQQPYKTLQHLTTTLQNLTTTLQNLTTTLQNLTTTLQNLTTDSVSS